MHYLVLIYQLICSLRNGKIRHFDAMHRGENRECGGF